MVSRTYRAQPTRNRERPLCVSQDIGKGEENQLNNQKHGGIKYAYIYEEIDGHNQKAEEISNKARSILIKNNNRCICKMNN